MQLNCIDSLEQQLQNLSVSSVEVSGFEQAGDPATLSAKAELNDVASSMKSKIMTVLDAAWNDLSSTQQAAMSRKLGGEHSRWHEDGRYWDYDRLSLQRGYVLNRFEQTAENVYHALMETRKHVHFAFGSSPEVVVLGRGPAPELAAVKVFLQQLRVPSAKFKFVDNANWDLAWSAISSMGYIQHEKVDLWEQSPDWWHQLGKAQIVIGWFAHEVLSRKLHVSMLEELVKKGAIVLLACPVAGRSFFAQQADYSGLAMKATCLGSFDKQRAYLFTRRRADSCLARAAIAQKILNIADPAAVRGYVLDTVISDLELN